MNLKKYKLHWFLEVLKTIKIFKNWPSIIRSYFYSDKTIKAILRDGTEFVIRTNRVDRIVIKEIFAEKVYHRYINQLKDNSVVIDIGGNIGAFSLLAARQNRGIKVYTYEPFEENFLILNDNIKLNGLYQQIKAFNVAVSGTEGVRTVFSGRSDARSNLYENEGEKLQIKTCTLRNILEDNEISICDLLKMDCEGAEYEILYSTPDEIFDRIKTISMEYHEYFGTGKGSELKLYLEKHGFQVIMHGKEVGYIHAEKLNNETA